LAKPVTGSIGNPVFTGPAGTDETVRHGADGDVTAGPVDTDDTLRDDRAGNHTTTVPV
jgi:hypothetical protein